MDYENRKQIAEWLNSLGYDIEITSDGLWIDIALTWDEKRLKIAILDSEPDYRSMLQDALEEEGFTVKAYNKDKDFLEDIESAQFDIIITDLERFDDSTELTEVQIINHLLKNLDGFKKIIVNTGSKKSEAEQMLGANVNHSRLFVCEKGKLSEFVNLIKSFG